MTDDERKQLDEWKTPHAPWRTGQIVEKQWQLNETQQLQPTPKALLDHGQSAASPAPSDRT